MALKTPSKDTHLPLHDNYNNRPLEQQESDDDEKAFRHTP
jgi:hypothetical protein